MKHTRREFLQCGISAPFAAVLAAPGRTLSLIRPNENPVWKRFSQPQIIRYDSECFTIHDRDVFLFGAEFHYARCPQQLWPDRFLKLRGASFNTIESMVFWNYHELEEGHFDFTEFEDFIKVANKMGFWVIVRPGPYICAEFERGGFPRCAVAPGAGRVVRTMEARIRFRPRRPDLPERTLRRALLHFWSAECLLSSGLLFQARKSEERPDSGGRICKAGQCHPQGADRALSGIFRLSDKGGI
jgi:Glycosyl hydrolases family 35